MNTLETKLFEAIDAITEIPQCETFSKKFRAFVASALVSNTGLHQYFVTENGGADIETDLNIELLNQLIGYKLEANHLSVSLSHALFIYFQAVQESPLGTDLLSVIHATALRSEVTKHNAQHMTPPNLSDACVRFLGTKMESTAVWGDLTGCGAGALILAGMRNTYNNRGDVKHPFLYQHIYAVDKDPLCAAMTALQIYANRVWKGQPVGKIEVHCADVITGVGHLFFKSEMNFLLADGSRAQA